MRVRSYVVFLLIAVVVSVTACKKKEEPVSSIPAPAPTPGIVMPKGETRIVVPDSVRGKWESVKIEITNKTAKKKETVTIRLNSDYPIPGSSLKIKVGEFLPDFRMDGLTITSASDAPKNPAVHITVYDGDKEIFKGWLYSKFPSIHPFQHEKYGFMLIEGIKKG
ncbi:hypothetical protein BMS3Bbin06_01145 [bacterium BMS3Bbin06]|nr:hypothetical protein BMS3Abin08_01203 [bacterium BMS3Abin08]GBE34616.1 hypothetical protein BMS3Bbin06_01145 [bacterium BMS3Bbin06]HDO35812.1 DUF2155 domain-containing protein [Nitrospirota bacterium]HDY70367.1 DUF2155 domain-containing protein [Nitrospirota bacterium]